MAAKREYDLLVIGSGPAGQKGAIQAAKLGKRVCVVEKRGLVGGVSLHTGTIPSKTLREAVLYLTGWSQRGLYGAQYRLKPQVTMRDVKRRLKITLKHELAVMEDQLRRNGVEVIRGIASLTSRRKVSVRLRSGRRRTLAAKSVLLATGTTPMRPPDIPFDNERIVDSDGVFRLRRKPASMIVIGGGVIGLEYATIFDVLGVKVTVLDRRERLLDFADSEIVGELLRILKKRKMRLRLGADFRSVRVGKDGKVTIRLASGDRLRADVVLVAAGRRGCTDGLGLENAGLLPDEKGRIKVDRCYRTSVPGLAAAGDVIGFPSLASTAMEQGRLAAAHSLGARCTRSPHHFPFGIYAIPEFSMAGKTEDELKAERVPYFAGRAQLWETARGQILGLRSGMIKLLFAKNGRRLLGVHILGEGSTELVHIGQTAINLGGTLEYLVESVFNYPTLAEAYKAAALDAWNRI